MALATRVMRAVSSSLSSPKVSLPILQFVYALIAAGVLRGLRFVSCSKRHLLLGLLLRGEGSL